MDKAAYLLKKQLLQVQAQSFKREETCYSCYWIKENCRCHLIKPFSTDTRFIILMHPMEAKKEKLGTGRICRATLLNSEIIVGIDFTKNEQVNALIANPENSCRVLYPGEKSLNISSDDISPLLATQKAGQKSILFLIDGTWPCAKKMMTLSLNIRRLPRLSFTGTRESIFNIKEQPAAYCLSTLESIHHFLDESHRRGLERLPARPHDNLILVFQSMIDFMLMCALDPNRSSYRPQPRGYSLRENRKKRKKSEMRSIILKD